MLDYNRIKRETFIDNNFNSKFQHVDIQNNDLIDDMQANGENRFGRYGILLKYINTNIKEITEIITSKIESPLTEKFNSNNLNFNELLEFDEKETKDNIYQNISNIIMDSIDEFYIKEEDGHTINLTSFNNFSKEISGIKSRIDLNSTDNLEKTICQFENIEFIKNTNVDNRNNRNENKKY